MKFKVVEKDHVEFFKGECPDCLGSGVVKKLVKNNKPWKVANKYVTKETPCPKCKGKGEIKEDFTGSGAGYPAATDAAGNQAIDKAPTLLGGKKKKKMARRVKAKKTFVT